jgi:hypothetical protein
MTALLLEQEAAIYLRSSNASVLTATVPNKIRTKYQSSSLRVFHLVGLSSDSEKKLASLAMYSRS